MKVAINKCFGMFRLSKEAYNYLGLEWDGYGTEYNDNRIDIKLIECINKLGKLANGEFADIKIIEIPDNIKYYIDNDEGIETVHEEHRTWR